MFADAEMPAEGRLAPQTEAALADLNTAVDRLQQLAALATGGEAMEVAQRLHLAANRLAAAHTAAVTVAADSGQWAEDGYATPASWIADTHNVESAPAAGLIRDGRWLRRWPQFATALASGTISVADISALRRVVDATATRRDAFPAFAQEFLTVASKASAQRTAKVIRAWADQIDPAPEDDADQKAYDRRRVFLNPLGDGWDLRGSLPGVEGANLAAVLNEIMESERRASCSCHLRSCTCPDDGRTPAQRRADALITLAATAMSEGGALRTPTSILRTRAILIVRATDLDPDAAASCASAPGESGAGWPTPMPTPQHRPDDFMSTWLAGSGPGEGLLARRAVLRHLCDTTLQRLIVSPTSAPLDIGRETRTIPTAVRTALIVRDRGCVFPSCDRPPSWCHGHHIRHWAHGGSTALDNLALVCARHHALIHTGRWTIWMTPEGHPLVAQAGTGAETGPRHARAPN